MINEGYKAMLGGKSVIRELSEYATARGSEIGYDNVFDYSLGNPSVPCPPSFTEAMIDLYRTAEPVALHGYSPSLGIPSVRATIADSLNRRFGMDYTADYIFPTSGAAGALAHALRAVTKPGDEIITFAPYFPEYQPYVAGTGARLTIVPADTENFQINFAAFEAAMNPGVTAVLINTPNNPSGAVYSEETLERLAGILTAKQAEYGHDIFLISDEPYREIVFDGGTQPYPSRFYDNTLSCYSWSKSLSLPGERIGYVAVNPRATDAKLIVPMCGQISRGTGHNCPSSSIQLAVAKVVDETSDLSVYETNMNLLYDALTSIGFDVVRPGGTFYIFPKALEGDANAFCMKAKEYDLILVPSNSFGVPGYFRMAYCIDTDKVRRSIPVLEKFAHEVYGL
ncbi:MAG: pyridoxal phosphate-dependent aminotransferase [Bifidobacterium scardovii]|uniref:pyridoxal phosphate-dependent aminotransferase n=1 Tax=Bifidobacterium scardovii TaxID=158787 RepID=UPI000664FDF0|nr:pyridoxal phosphate-dependent aminotransferase [Bifidobacterium scardovii]MBS6947475.1 pyridoxal phosphate-dependent aminotransferase [Bifidobacterium scardovii]MDU3736790.1 pyridoxal phosphate-dependent aminotransferase [Bifidobacterium scardovii]MDU5296163.1 pyridoxal phosphate-dependent aminotransferase [Bifidobacterium scardovii]MDU5610797.1 pyridoxal phosphate-dependent aminotransferase [Bifidobacterium scardovii]MDU5886021.1 pyridoxal phosphate-dependent aminotransferase [Bifidobacter